jgi:acetyltransferase-like isoleucine patch superfamily enzyme
LKVKSRLQKVFAYSKAFLETLHLKYYLVNLVCGFLPKFSSGAIRTYLYRLAGFKLGKGCFIMGNIELLSGKPDLESYLVVGENVLISTNVTLNLDEKITIGKNVTLSPFVKIYTSTHKIGPQAKRCSGDAIFEPVVIEDGCWIALGATILPGVRIGYGSVVAAGAVVNKDIPPNSFVAGIPGKVIRELL